MMTRSVGYGIVGGSMVTFEEIGRKAAQLGIRILAGEDAQAIARAESYQPVLMFDERQLRRWKISEQRLPPGSIVRFKEATYWEQYHRIIVFGFSPSERLELDAILKKLHPDDREALQGVFAKALAGGGSYETEFRLILPDDGIRWISSHGRVEFDANGQPVRIRGASRDITADK